MTHYKPPRPGSEFERSTPTEYDHSYYQRRMAQIAADDAERSARQQGAASIHEIARLRRENDELREQLKRYENHGR